MDAIFGFLFATCFSSFVAQIVFGHWQRQSADRQAALLAEIRDLLGQRTKDQDLFQWTRTMFEKIVEATTVDRLGRDIIPYTQQKRMVTPTKPKPETSPPSVTGSWAPPRSTILKTEG